MENLFLTREEVAKILRMTPSGIDQAYKTGSIPAPIKFSRRNVRFVANDFTAEGLKAWAQREKIKQSVLNDLASKAKIKAALPVDPLVKPEPEAEPNLFSTLTE